MKNRAPLPVPAPGWTPCPARNGIWPQLDGRSSKGRVFWTACPHRMMQRPTPPLPLENAPFQMAQNVSGPAAPFSFFRSVTLVNNPDRSAATRLSFAGTHDTAGTGRAVWIFRNYLLQVQVGRAGRKRPGFSGAFFRPERSGNAADENDGSPAADETPLPLGQGARSKNAPYSV